MAPEKVLPSGGGRPWGTCQPHISPTTHPIGTKPGTYTPFGNRNRTYILNSEERAWLWLHPREVHHCSAFFSTTVHPLVIINYHSNYQNNNNLHLTKLYQRLQAFVHYCYMQSQVQVKLR